MTKKILSLFAILALLASPTLIVANEVEVSENEWFEGELDFGTDSYDIDGCFC